MQIDWLTFSAQVVNFLILVFLLHRFLYRPLVSAMERRRGEIERRLREGEEMQEEARRRAEELEERHRELEERREEELRRIESQAEERRSERMEEVRVEVERRRRRWTEALERERQAFLDELARRVSGQAVAVARRALEDLADADLERTAAGRFVERLRELDGDGRRELVRAVERADRREGEEPVVRSAFELPDDQRQRIRRALRDVLGDAIEPRFERDEDLALGVELTVGGVEIGWTLERYLGDLEADIAGLLEEETGGGPGAPGTEEAT